MPDPAGILLHVQLTAAVGQIIEVLTNGKAIPGTMADQHEEVRRRTERLATAYNKSLRWSRTVAKALEASDAR